jgi:O-antigen/teichoic acid export membrane protein
LTPNGLENDALVARNRLCYRSSGGPGKIPIAPLLRLESASMSLHRRLASNTVINILALGLNALLQLLQVSLLTAVWSLEKYGVWVMLSTIPTYFSLSDLGFSSAAQSDMSMSYASGDIERTRGTYQSIWLLMLVVSLGIVVVSLPLLLFQSGAAAAHVPVLRDYGRTIFLFIALAAITLCSRLVLAGFRATGLYALGSMVYEVTVFVTGIAMIAVAMAGGSFDACILVGIAFRAVLTVATDVMLRRLRPIMRIGFTHASLAEIRRLVKPAFAAMATPIALALNLQGITIVVGYVLSPVAVAVLTPVRTASRIALQVVGALNRGAMPEVSRAVSLGDEAAVARLLRANAYSLLYALLPGAVLFALLGQQFVIRWTGGKVSPEFLFTCLMAAAMFVQGLWYFMSNFLLATNEHVAISKSLLVSSIVAVLLAVPAGRWAGLDGVAVAILCGEVLCFVNVYAHYRRSSFGMARA